MSDPRFEQGGNGERPIGAPRVNSDDAIKRYRRRRERFHRQRRASLRRTLQLSEADEIAQFASEWAPYGGVPEEETFARFGMPVSRFMERLREIPSEVHGDEMIHQLLGKYFADGVSSTD